MIYIHLIWFKGIDKWFDFARQNNYNYYEQSSLISKAWIVWLPAVQKENTVNCCFALLRQKNIFIRTFEMNLFQKIKFWNFRTSMVVLSVEINICSLRSLLPLEIKRVHIEINAALYCVQRICVKQISTVAILGIGVPLSKRVYSMTCIYYSRKYDLMEFRTDVTINVGQTYTFKMNIFVIRKYQTN